MTTQTLTLLFLAATNTFNLPPHLLESVCYVESKHTVNAIHHDDGGTDSVGVCQIKYTTAKGLGYTGTEQGLMRLSVNIFYAAKFLARQQHRYHGSIDKAVIAYNRGNAIGLTETDYSIKVLREYDRRAIK